MIKINFTLFFIITLTLNFYTQLSVTSIEKLPIPNYKEWNSPIFAPNGKSIFITSSDYNGIWQFFLSSKELKQITDAKSSGYGFSVSQDGKFISYRITTYLSEKFERKQEIVLQSLIDGNKEIIASGSDVSTPIFQKNNLLFTVDGNTKNLEKISNDVFVLGIDYSKIVLIKNGKKEILDPIKNGSYIWPFLSPNNKKIVAQDVTEGTFICNLNGRILSKIGRRNFANWTKNGRWIIYMDDVDDGHKITSSDISAISPDGKKIISLTNTPNVIELYPSPSPTNNSIVCCSLDGNIYLIKYKENVK